MKIFIYSDGNAYSGCEYYYNTENKKFYEEKYMWHIDDSREFFHPKEISPKNLSNELMKKLNVLALEKIRDECGFDTTEYLNNIIKIKEKRVNFWQDKASELNLFNISHSDVFYKSIDLFYNNFDKRINKYQYKRIYDRLRNTVSLKFTICNNPLISLSVVFDKNNQNFLFYYLSCYIRKRYNYKLSIDDELELYQLSIHNEDIEIINNLLRYYFEIENNRKRCNKFTSNLSKSEIDKKCKSFISN